MIATAGDPVSPHESTAKDTALAPMVSPNAITQEITQEKRETEEEKEDNNWSGSDGSEYDEDEEERHSAEFQQLTLDSLDGEGLPDDTPRTVGTASDAKGTDTAQPAKRVLRRKRKRMSEDERRVRHREVQRQFMKRKRARLGEMRKVLRGLDAHHRLVKASNERAMLEKENAALVERLTAPGSGWEWDDAPPDTHEEKHESTPGPRVVYLVPEHGHLAFHHQAPHHTPSVAHYDSHASGMQLHWHYPPLYYHALPPPPAEHHHQAMLPSVAHGMAHRPAVPGVPGVTLPWDDILDAVTGESVDISF